MNEDMIGKTATLREPYKGYSNVTLIEKVGYKWLVELGSGKQIEVFSDEFVLDED